MKRSGALALLASRAKARRLRFGSGGNGMRGRFCAGLAGGIDDSGVFGGRIAVSGVWGRV